MKVLVIENNDKIMFEDEINKLTTRAKVKIIDIKFSPCFDLKPDVSANMRYNALIMYNEIK